MLSNATISMGQEVSLTPLQLARAAAAIANGGRLVRPRLVRRIAHPDGKVENFQPPPAEQAISEETARNVRNLMVGVVERGTGRKAAIPGFVVAGKTGTAQKAGIGGYQAGRYVASFVGFAPSENPRVVGLVLIEEPRGGKYYGGDIAAPVFARVVSQALSILRVAPEEQRLPETLLASTSAQRVRYPEGVVPASVHTSEGIATTVPVTFEPPAISGDGGAPSAVGLSARQALALFARHGLSAKVVGSGFVVEQVPAPGSPVRPGSVCTLRLAEPAAAPAPGSERRVEEPAAPLPAP
jgi:membrane peptidoglycan carboxypeptidase